MGLQNKDRTKGKIKKLIHIRNLIHHLKINKNKLTEIVVKHQTLLIVLRSTNVEFSSF